MVKNRNCQARQQSDQMCCGRCGLAWDVNDPDPPDCKPVVAKIQQTTTVAEIQQTTSAVTETGRRQLAKIKRMVGL